MISHVKILAWLHIVLGALGALGGLALLAFFSGLAGFLGVSGRSAEAGIAVPILGGIGVLLFIILAIISVPGIVAGAGLLQFAPWARILTIVLSALHLFNVPFGTALGVYGLWVLTRPETEQLFSRPRYQAPGY